MYCSRIGKQYFIQKYCLFVFTKSVDDNSIVFKTFPLFEAKLVLIFANLCNNLDLE